MRRVRLLSAEQPLAWTSSNLGSSKKISDKKLTSQKRINLSGKIVIISCSQHSVVENKQNKILQNLVTHLLNLKYIYTFLCSVNRVKINFKTNSFDHNNRMVTTDFGIHESIINETAQIFLHYDEVNLKL